MTRQEEILRFINKKIREPLGLKPIDTLRKGNMRNGDSCVITNSVQVGLSSSRYRVFTDGEDVSVTDDITDKREIFVLPKHAKSFVRGFDNGKHPDLVIGGARKPVAEYKGEGIT